MQTEMARVMKQAALRRPMTRGPSESLLRMLDNLNASGLDEGAIACQELKDRRSTTKTVQYRRSRPVSVNT